MRGDRIRKLREELGWTQEELAERIGTEVLSINRYENNKTKNPDLTKVTALAEALECSVDYLLGLTDSPTPKQFENYELRTKERVALSAWRRGDRFQAIKVIVDDE